MRAIEIYANSALGIYIPQHFAESCADGWTGIDLDDRDILLHGPDHEWYLDAWYNVLNSAEYHAHGHVWRLEHDGDLFSVCDELMTDQEHVDFYGEEREA